MKNKIKKTILCLLCFVMVENLIGCTNAENDLDMSNPTVSKEQEYIEYMVSHYGFEESDFEGMDVVAFVEEYELIDDTCTPEEAHEIYDGVADIYVYTESDKVYGFIEKDTEDSAASGVKTDKIGFYLNEGTFAQNAVFDIKEGIFYVDDLNTHELSEESKEALSDIVSRYNVDKWEKNPQKVGTDQASTANFAWRLVFVTADGKTCSYYGGLGYDNPEEAGDIILELTQIIKG